MRVALDVSPLDRDFATGVEKGLLRLLAGLAEDPGEHEYLLVAPRRPALLPEISDPRFELHEIGGKPRWWRERAAPRFAARERVSIWHAPVQAIPLRLSCPRVATVHEISWKETTGVEDEGRVGRRKLVTWAVARTAERVICVSGATERRFLELHPEARPRTTVVPHGIPRSCFDPAVDRDGLAARYGVPADRPYFLTLGRALKRKGLPGAVRAFDAFVRATGAPHALVMAGPKNERFAAAVAEAAAVGMGERCCAPGYIDEADLAALLAAADAFLVPSESEGFGIPVLEAMAAGAPVVVNARAALPEVAGDAGLLVDFDRPAAVARAMERAIGPERPEWVRRGRRRAEDYPLEATVQATLAVWRALAGVDSAATPDASARR